LKRQRGQRHTACIRNISAPQRSHATFSPPSAHSGLAAPLVRIGCGMNDGFPGSGMGGIMPRDRESNGTTGRNHSFGVAACIQTEHVSRFRPKVCLRV